MTTTPELQAVLDTMSPAERATFKLLDQTTKELHNIVVTSNRFMLGAWLMAAVAAVLSLAGLAALVLCVLRHTAAP